MLYALLFGIRIIFNYPFIVVKILNVKQIEIWILSYLILYLIEGTIRYLYVGLGWWIYGSQLILCNRIHTIQFGVAASWRYTTKITKPAKFLITHNNTFLHTCYYLYVFIMRCIVYVYMLLIA